MEPISKVLAFFVNFTFDRAVEPFHGITFGFLRKLCSRYGEMMREKKPNVGFVILAPLSRHSLGDGGSHPFKKSEKTFLFAFTYLCREQSLQQKKQRRV